MFRRGEMAGGRYEVLDRRHADAQRAVYVGQDTASGEQVTIKWFARSGYGPTLAFERSLDLNRRLEALGFGRVLAVEPHAGGDILVVPHVQGESLADLRARMPLGEAEVRPLLASLAEQLTPIHAAGVIHRDIKPDNVIVPVAADFPRFDQASLIDFCIAGELEADSNLTRTGEVFGTPFYMSPEQVRGIPQGPATDVYGLGALGFFALYGRPPHDDADSGLVLLRRILDEPVALPVAPPVSDAFGGLLLRCLSKEPLARPADAAALLALLDAVAAPLSAAPAAPAPAAPPPQRLAGAALSPTKRRGSSTLVLIGLSAAVLLLAAAAVTLLVVLDVQNVPSPTAAGAAGAPTDGPTGGVLRGLILGAVAILAGPALGFSLYRLLRARRSEIERKADQVLLGAASRDELTRSVALQLDTLIQRCRTLEERILGRTVTIMLREYEEADGSADRQTALMNAVGLLEKLVERMSPWYVRHSKLLAAVSSLTVTAGGLVSLAKAFASLF